MTSLQGNELTFMEECKKAFFAGCYVSKVFYPDVNTCNNTIRPLHLYHPKNQRGLKLQCPLPEHWNEELDFKGKWTTDSNINFSPRPLFDLGQKVILVSALYYCEKCKQNYVASDSALFSQTKNICRGFYLLSYCGFTQQAYNAVVSLATSGVPFQTIQELFEKCSMISQSMMQYYKDGTSEVAVTTGLCPSAKSLRFLFTQHMTQRREIIEASFLQYSPREASIDHTFQIR